MINKVIQKIWEESKKSAGVYLNGDYYLFLKQNEQVIGLIKDNKRLYNEKEDLLQKINLNKYDRYYLPCSDIDPNLDDMPIIVAHIEDDYQHPYYLLVVNPVTEKMIFAVQCKSKASADKTLYEIKMDSKAISIIVVDKLVKLIDKEKELKAESSDFIITETGDIELLN